MLQYCAKISWTNIQVHKNTQALVRKKKCLHLLKNAKFEADSFIHNVKFLFLKMLM